MRKFYVYVHVCPNGKRYVGCTKQARPELRWKEGNGYRYNKHFYSAILKYGWTNFQHEVFEVDSAEEMYRKEVELISFYHSNDPEFGYNNSSGGEKGASGCIRSEEVRKHMSEVQKKVHSDPEYRRKLSEALKGKPNPHSEEHRKHLAEAQKKVQKKVHSDPEYRRKQSETHKGKSFSEEHRKHLAEANRRTANDPERVRKIAEAHKGKLLSEEHRKHIAESKKGKPRKPHSEETRKRIAEAMKGKPKPRIKISLPDGTIVEVSKHILTRYYINKGKEFEYVS